MESNQEIESNIDNESSRKEINLFGNNNKFPEPLFEESVEEADEEQALQAMQKLRHKAKDQKRNYISCIALYFPFIS